jgi:ParB family chromosome partitioning protein
MGLVENVARRRPSNVELLREITSLKQRGYTVDQISAKLDMHRSYVHGVVNLLERGEEKLIDHVERGRIPISVAVTIASGTDAEVQQALCEAYENGALRGHKLTTARRIIAQRLTKDKKLDKTRVRAKRSKLSGDALVREYQRHIQKQRQLVRKAEVTNERILLMASALKQLLADEGFVTVLRAERLDTMPEVLAHRVTR